MAQGLRPTVDCLHFVDAIGSQRSVEGLIKGGTYQVATGIYNYCCTFCRKLPNLLLIRSLGHIETFHNCNNLQNVFYTTTETI